MTVPGRSGDRNGPTFVKPRAMHHRVAVLVVDSRRTRLPRHLIDHDDAVKTASFLESESPRGVARALH
jgi:hypothetical protein